MQAVSASVLMAAVIVTIGCHRPDATTPRKTSSTAAKSSDALPDDSSPQEPTPQEPTLAMNSEPTSAQSNGLAPSSDSVNSDSPSSPASPDAIHVDSRAAAQVASDLASPPIVPPPVPEAIRCIWISPSGPVLLEFTIWIDGLPLEASWQKTLARITELVDQNTDQQITWDELTQSRHVLHGQFGSPPIRSEQNRLERIQQFDLNRDQTVQSSELMAFLSGNSVRTDLVSFEASDSANRSVATTVFGWLDQNGDHLLAREEMLAVTDRLRWWDANGDGQVTREERSASAGPPPPMRAPRRTQPSFRPLTRLVKNLDWADLLFRLEDYYAGGSPLRVDDMPARATWFQQIDSNQDGTWDADELKSCLTRSPDWTIEWRMTEQLTWPRIVRVSRADRSSSSLDDARLPESDRSEAPGWWPWTERQWLRFGAARRVSAEPPALLRPLWDQQVGDPPAAALDAAKYQPLEPLVRLPLVAVDFNEDGLVTWQEVTQAWQQRAEAEAARLLLQVQVEPDPLESLIDANADGRLSEREIGEAAERLQICWQGRDATTLLAEDQLPQFITWKLSPSRSDSEMSEPTIDSPVLPTVSAPGLPAWFVAQDLNRDGELSRGEFLGEPTRFDTWDVDTDGFLEASELSEVGDH